VADSLPLPLPQPRSLAMGGVTVQDAPSDPFLLDYINAFRSAPCHTLIFDNLSSSLILI